MREVELKLRLGKEIPIPAGLQVLYARIAESSLATLELPSVQLITVIDTYLHTNVRYRQQFTSHPWGVSMTVPEPNSVHDMKKRITRTVKNKVLVDGVEVNDESEEDILEIPPTPPSDIRFQKIKTGVTISFPPELSLSVFNVADVTSGYEQIVNLGTYIEIEQLGDSASKDHLLSLLDELKFSRELIEPRSWGELAEEARGGAQ